MLLRVAMIQKGANHQIPIKHIDSSPSTLGADPMNELVFIEKHDCFTNTQIIADGTELEHKSVVLHLKKQQKRFEQLGKIRFSDLKSPNPQGGRPTRVYKLNEPQASFLMTLLGNSDIVVEFKFRLVQEFYTMKQFMIEQGVAEKYKHWKALRAEGKLARLEETDSIRDILIPLIESQNPDSTYVIKPQLVYQNYSKLVNSILGITKGERDKLPHSYLRTIEMMENAIQHIIKEEAPRETHYKEIYQKCKEACNQIKNVSFLPSKGA